MLRRINSGNRRGSDVSVIRMEKSATSDLKKREDDSQ
jgi:hypothetical protein